MRRRWRSVEVGAARAPRERFAPAAVVARAVGALALEAGTHEVGAAGPGAVAGCAPGVARMVDVALARLVLDALPGRISTEPEPPRAACVRPPLRRAHEGAGPSRGRLPQAGWWGRDEAAHPVDAREVGLGALWPRVSEARSGMERRARTMCGPSCDRQMLDLAWRTLEKELEPSNRRVTAGGGGR